MEPLTIKMEQAKRTCNTCLTTSPKKVPTTPTGGFFFIVPEHHKQLRGILSGDPHGRRLQSDQPRHLAGCGSCRGTRRGSERGPGETRATTHARFRAGSRQAGAGLARTQAGPAAHTALTQ